MSKTIRTAIMIVLVSFIASLIYLKMSQNPITDKSAKTIYDLTFVDSQDRQFRLSELKGKIAVINFWATYCGPCRDEMPDLSNISDSYKDNNVVILGIASDEMNNVKEFLETTKVSYRNVAAEFEAIDISNSLGNESNVLPFTVILAPEGNVLFRHAGRIIPEKIREVVDLALSKKE